MKLQIQKNTEAESSKKDGSQNSGFMGWVFSPCYSKENSKNMPSPLCNVRKVFAANLNFIYKRIFLLKEKKVTGLNRESEYFDTVILTGY